MYDEFARPSQRSPPAKIEAKVVTGILDGSSLSRHTCLPGARGRGGGGRACLTHRKHTSNHLVPDQPPPTAPTTGKHDSFQPTLWRTLDRWREALACCCGGCSVRAPSASPGPWRPSLTLGWTPVHVKRAAQRTFRSPRNISVSSILRPSRVRAVPVSVFENPTNPGSKTLPPRLPQSVRQFRTLVVEASGGRCNQLSRKSSGGWLLNPGPTTTEPQDTGLTIARRIRKVQQWSGCQTSASQLDWFGWPASSRDSSVMPHCVLSLSGGLFWCCVVFLFAVFWRGGKVRVASCGGGEERGGEEGAGAGGRRRCGVSSSLCAVVTPC